LTATISGAYSDLSPTLNLTTTPGLLSITTSLSGSCSNGYQTWLLTANPNMATATNWQWTVDNPSSGYYSIQSPNSQSTYVTVSGGGGVSVTYKDQCGETSPKDGVTIYSQCRASAIAVYPNPANSQLTVANNNINTTDPPVEANSNLKALKEFSVELYDDKGKVLKSGKNTIGNQNIVLNTSNILNGLYFLHIIQGTDLIEKKIIIQH
jgi:hypothetical protein